MSAEYAGIAGTVQPLQHDSDAQTPPSPPELPVELELDPPDDPEPLVDPDPPDEPDTLVDPEPLDNPEVAIDPEPLGDPEVAVNPEPLAGPEAAVDIEPVPEDPDDPPFVLSELPDGEPHEITAPAVSQSTNVSLRMGINLSRWRASASAIANAIGAPNQMFLETRRRRAAHRPFKAVLELPQSPSSHRRSGGAQATDQGKPT